MENYKYKPDFFDDFFKVSEKAKQIAAEENTVVEFEFNGKLCLVNQDTNLKNLFRDYQNAYIMEWEVVGPYCVDEYGELTAKELARKTKIMEENQAKQEAEWSEKENKEREVFAETVKGIEIELRNPVLWQEYKDKNQDGYGGACVEYAEGWAKLMQQKINTHGVLRKGVKEIIEEFAGPTSFQLGFLGITGFMYGAAVQMLSECWQYGETLRVWHNKEYNHEGEGVVNPALLTVKDK